LTVIQGERLKLSEQDFFTNGVSSHKACKFPCFFQGALSMHHQETWLQQKYGGIIFWGGYW